MDECLSCGMPMAGPEDHGGGDHNNDWCVHCCHQDGTHKTYQEVLDGLSAFLMSDAAEEMGTPKARSLTEAHVRAGAYLLHQPAWSDDVAII
ncbi:MAG: zinc ribbon domain-containing protein [Rhodothermales bacterium]